MAATASESDDFLAALDVFARSVRRARGVTVSGTGQGLTLSQYGLLEPLADQNAARVHELAAQAGIAPPTATRILDALERRGIVERRRSDQDRRAVEVTLTELGRATLGRHYEWMRASERAFYVTLPDRERELAPDLLMRLGGLIDELAAGPDAITEPR